MTNQKPQLGHGPANRFVLDGVGSPQAEHRSVVILGGGPAGLTAAFYAARATLAPLVLQGVEPGGQLITTTQVENYPGFAEGILGPELMQRFADQAARFGTELRYGSVTAVDVTQRPSRLLVDDDDVVLADAVIIATGASQTPPDFLVKFQRIDISGVI